MIACGLPFCNGVIEAFLNSILPYLYAIPVFIYLAVNSILKYFGR